MWSRLDDSLLDHSKVFAAGSILGGGNGPAIALGFFAAALLWSNKHLTDGYVPNDILRHLRHAEKPLVVADALTRAGLFERVKGGIQIHDFREYNPPAAAILKRRRADRLRKHKQNGGKP